MLSRGDRVRVTLSAEETRRTGRGLVSGRLVSGDSAYVVIMRGDAARADTIPTFTIDEVELYTGQRSRSRMIVVGTALGVAASGMVWGYDRLSRDSRCGRMNECPPLLPSGYYAIPIAAGAVSGATFSASRWISVPRRAIYLGFAASRAVQLTAAMQFR